MVRTFLMCALALSLLLHGDSDNKAIKMGERLRNLGSWQPTAYFTEMISDFCNEYPF